MKVVETIILQRRDPNGSQEVDQQLEAEKSQRTDGRSGYRRGYRPRCLDTHMGTMYLMVPKVRQGGYIPFFVTERKRSEAALIQVVQKSFPGASWQRCKVHFMRNILAYVPQKEKKSFAAVLKEIWLAPTAELARRRAYDVMDAYAKRFPKVVQCLENGLEDSLTRHPMSAW